MGAPRRVRRSVERYSIVMPGWRSQIKGCFAANARFASAVMSSASHEGSSVNGFLPMAIRGELSFPQGIPPNPTSGGITIPATVPHSGRESFEGTAPLFKRNFLTQRSGLLALTGVHQPSDLAPACLATRRYDWRTATPCFLAVRFSHSIARKSRWLSDGRPPGLRRRVDRQPPHLRRLDCARSPGRSQRLGDERLQLLRADAAAPHPHRGPVERQRGLKIGLAAEILKVGILD